MAAALRDAHGVRRGDRVGILCRNGTGLIRGLFAAARLGARVTLLNPEMSPLQLASILERHHLRLVLVDPDTQELVNRAACTVLVVEALLANSSVRYRRLGRVTGGELVVLTGGTTGPPNAARRKPSVRNFLLLFLHLVAALELDRYPSAYVAVPLFHGYGIAALLVALTLGRTVYLAPQFKAAAACRLIESERIEAVVVVPSMLQRLIADSAHLSSLRCVISGGAALSPQLVLATRERLGDVLFNLYGTSEGGVAVFATPADLADSPDTIGREIWGVIVTIRDPADICVPDGQLGRLCVQSKAAVEHAAWIETGDFGCRDKHGRLFVRGRIDDMIVSGGENVSPWEIETVLMTHPEVGEVAAVGVPDADYGQRLLAFVVLKQDSTLTAEALLSWLTERVARYQRPREIHLRSGLPLTAIGKIDKRALVSGLSNERWHGQEHGSSGRYQGGS
jgi:acyl-CoA synthetase (AMP-forming)/AMP-acid ligase II